MDSAGIGELPDAALYRDEGSNTIGNIARQVGLRVPTLRSLGLSRVVAIGGAATPLVGAYGRMAEASPGKDSVTGHWEMAGLVLDKPFPTFPGGFPEDLIQQFERRIGRPTLGNSVASGTAIIDQLGAEHVRTGAPIVYTSADSVFQIAAHEEVVPLAELYRWCEIAFELAGRGLGVGRVIARPFVGAPGSFARTTNRRDFALEPFGPTLLDNVKSSGLPVVGVGKIEDLFAGRGFTKAIHTTSDADGMNVIAAELTQTQYRIDLREPGGLRHRLRPPQRRGWIRRQSRAVRHAPVRSHPEAPARRPVDRDRRSRERSDDAVDRSLA